MYGWLVFISISSSLIAMEELKEVRQQEMEAIYQATKVYEEARIEHYTGQQLAKHIPAKSSDKKPTIKAKL